MSKPLWLQLAKLLPRLGNKNRLEVVQEIDRLLAVHGISWAEVADMLVEAMTPRRHMVPAADLLALIERIEQAPDLLSDHALNFLAQQRENAAEGGEVKLTPRQGEWLWALFEKANKVVAEGGAARRAEAAVEAERLTQDHMGSQKRPTWH